MGRAEKFNRHADQLELFACLVVPDALPRTRARRPSAPLLRSLSIMVVQLSIDLAPRVDPEDEDDILVTSPIVHAWMAAIEAPPPKTRAPRSIFDLAAAQVIAEAMRGDFDPDPAPKKIQQATHTRVIREAGVVRCQRLHHTDTEEWQTKEAARRARQKVPRPPKKARTISRKLVELVGGSDGP